MGTTIDVPWARPLSGLSAFVAKGVERQPSGQHLCWVPLSSDFIVKDFTLSIPKPLFDRPMPKRQRLRHRAIHRTVCRPVVSPISAKHMEKPDQIGESIAFCSQHNSTIFYKHCSALILMERSLAENTSSFMFRPFLTHGGLDDH